MADESSFKENNEEKMQSVNVNPRKKKICQICGDFSLGFNFGAVSCESCKAFFRRNAAKMKNLHCAFSDNCSIDLVTRRFCQKCRLQKCFTVGMKKEWIKTESEKNLKRKTKTETGALVSNGNKRKPNNLDQFHHSNEDALKNHDEENIESTENREIDHHQHQQNSNINLSTHPINENNTYPQNYSCPFQHKTMEYGGHGHDANTGNWTYNCQQPSTISVAQIIDMAISAEYESSPQQTLTVLSDREQSKLQELYIASRALAETIGAEEDLSFNKFNAEPSLISVINLTELAMKRIIKMSKQIFSFSQLCQEDQVSLLKGGCIELMVLRSVMNYDNEKHSWQIPAYSCLRVISSEVLKEASQLGVNLYEEHLRFASSFCTVWKNDENILLILSAIALFTPDRPNVVHQSVVKKVQDGYFYLLQRYLQTKFVGCQAQDIYLTLIGKLVELHRLNDAHTKLFMEVNPKQIEPLLIEIFDLNQQKWQF